MPVISAKIIEKPRKSRKCEQCRKAIVGRTLRLYGMGERGEKPYDLYLHPECEQGRETARALARWQKQTSGGRRAAKG